MVDTLIGAAGSHKALLVHVGIAGIEDAADALPYYRWKLACEQKLSASDVPHTICRATQFHPFIAQILDRLGWGPLQLRPPMRLQPVDPRSIAGAGKVGSNGLVLSTPRPAPLKCLH